MFKFQLDGMDLSGNKSVGKDGYEIVGELVNRCDMKQLCICECDPTSEELVKLKGKANVKKVFRLTVPCYIQSIIC